MSDLDQRRALSKSELSLAELCQWKAWHHRHHYLPAPAKEEIAFGRCVDKGVTELVEQMRGYGHIEDPGWSMRAAILEADQHTVEIDMEGVSDALTRFHEDVLPQFDWAYCLTQHHISVEMPGWGMVDGHPDLVLKDGTILDVKTGDRAKTRSAVLNSTELGFYALIRQVETGEPVPTVGYLSWPRGLKFPKWAIVIEPVTPELLSVTTQRVDAYVRARDMDTHLLIGGGEPVNVTLTAGPRFAGLCNGCQYVEICPVRAIETAA